MAVGRVVESLACRLPGPAVVRYGANGVYAEQTYRNGGNVDCTNTEFGGNPIRVTKTCEYSLL